VLIDALLDLVLPRRCVGCGRAGVGLCLACADVAPLLAWRDGLPVASAARYAGATRSAVIAYKERGRRDLADALSFLLVAAVLALDRRGEVLVPVPSDRRVAAARGGDHVARLAGRAARELGTRVVHGALRLDSAVRDSAGLGVVERAANLDHAMSGRPPPRPGLAAVLVDDVVTSGATLREAHRALRDAGWAVTAAATVARTELRQVRGSSGPVRRQLPDGRAAPLSPSRTRDGGLTLS
jgi:predicted amidophosphoribosyltransferase